MARTLAPGPLTATDRPTIIAAPAVAGAKPGRGPRSAAKQGLVTQLAHRRRSPPVARRRPVHMRAAPRRPARPRAAPPRACSPATHPRPHPAPTRRARATRPAGRAAPPTRPSPESRPAAAAAPSRPHTQPPTEPSPPATDPPVLATDRAGPRTGPTDDLDRPPGPAWEHDAAVARRSASRSAPSGHPPQPLRPLDTREPPGSDL